MRKNNLVALSAPQIVNDTTGKTYLNVTIPCKNKKEQRFLQQLLRNLLSHVCMALTV